MTSYIPQDSAADDLLRASKSFCHALPYHPHRAMVLQSLARIQMGVLYFAEHYGVHAKEIAEEAVKIKKELEEKYLRTDLENK